MLGGGGQVGKAENRNSGKGLNKISSVSQDSQRTRSLNYPPGVMLSAHAIKVPGAMALALHDLQAVLRKLSYQPISLASL